MVLILALISFLLMVSPLTFAQEVIESNPTTLSPQTASELTKKAFSYEFVEFPIDKLAKAITKRKNTVLIKLGKPAPCTATATRTIPVVFGSAYRLGPNPAQTTLTVEFLLDKETPNLPDFLPESVVLVSDKNKEVKRSEPKKNATSKNSGEGTKVVRELSDVATGTYYLHIQYSKEVIFKERILIQK